MARDTLPLHQTLSIVSMFLMIIAISLTTYSLVNSHWMSEHLSIRTVFLGTALNHSLPSPDDLVPDAQDKNCGGTLQDISKVLSSNKKGRLYLDGEIGLKDFCIYIRIKNLNLFTDLLPAMHYCHTYDAWENFGLKRDLSDKGAVMSKKLFDEAIDVADEVYDLLTASLSLMVIATFSTFMKTPFIANILKSRKIFQLASFILVLSAAIVTTWAIGLFVLKCDPKTLIDNEKQRKMESSRSDKKLVWGKIRTSQSFGKCVYIAIAADCVLILVLILSVIEYKLRRIIANLYNDDAFFAVNERLLQTEYERED